MWLNAIKRFGHLAGVHTWSSKLHRGRTGWEGLVGMTEAPFTQLQVSVASEWWRSCYFKVEKLHNGAFTTRPDDKIMHISKNLDRLWLVWRCWEDQSFPVWTCSLMIQVRSPSTPDSPWQLGWSVKKGFASACGCRSYREVAEWRERLSHYC